MMQPPATDEQRRAMSRFAFSALLSIVIVLIGVVWSWRVGLRANDLDDRLDHMLHPVILGADDGHHHEVHQ